MTPAQLEAEYASVSRRFEELKGMGLKLDMSRGKPGKEQLDLVSDMLTVLSKPEDCVEAGFDVRNYGELTGLPCAKKFFAENRGCKLYECFICGNASLSNLPDVTKDRTGMSASSTTVPPAPSCKFPPSPYPIRMPALRRYGPCPKAACTGGFGRYRRRW